MRLDFPHDDGLPAILMPDKLLAHEEVSRSYRYVFTALPDDPRIPLKFVTGKMVTISLVRRTTRCATSTSKGSRNFTRTPKRDSRIV